MLWRQKGGTGVKTLVIERQAVRQNISLVKEKAGSAVIYGVLTGDAQGTGLLEMARLLRDEGIGRFAVSEPEDAAALRKAGFVEEEILMLRSTTDQEELEALIDHNVVCTIGSYDTGVALNGLAEARSTVAEAHIHLDTGMGYGGFLTGEPDKFLSMYRYLSNVAISGIYTQVHTDKSGGKSAAGQLEEFQKAVAAIQAAGFETGLVHAAGSYALLHYSLPALDAVRVGSAFLGRCRRTKNDGLHRVGYGEAPLEEVRWLPKGHTVGNEVSVVLKKPTRVAVLPVGYQNGFGVLRPRPAGLWETIRTWWAGRRVMVRIGGQRARVIGRIGALETLLDVTDLKCGTGDKAVFELDPLYARGLTREYR